MWGKKCLCLYLTWLWSIIYIYTYIEIMNYILNHTCLICVTFRVMNQRYKFVYSSRKHLFSFFITNRFHSDYPLKFTHERFVLYSTIPPPKGCSCTRCIKDLCKGLNILFVVPNIMVVTFENILPDNTNISLHIPISSHASMCQIKTVFFSKVTIFQMWFINQQNDIS